MNPDRSTRGRSRSRERTDLPDTPITTPSSNNQVTPHLPGYDTATGKRKLTPLEIDANEHIKKRINFFEENGILVYK